MATAPAQAIVSVPRSSRRGVVIEATLGPTMIGQSAMICAAAGLWRRKAARVTPGTSAPNGRGPWTIPRRLVISRFVSSAIAPADLLLRWYDRHRRRLPWRAEPGEGQDPYRVWLSEIMLQQTTVTAVIPYYERFVSRFPTVQMLAAAPLDHVLSAWAGLGYYARARNLHACAQVVAEMGGFPSNLDALRALPGIGAYTAAAIGAIAFGIPSVPVDGNVERVVARLFAIEQPMPAAKPALRLAAGQTRQRPGGAGEAQRLRSGAVRSGSVAMRFGGTGLRAVPMGRRSARGAGWALQPTCHAGRRRKLRPLRYGVHFWLTDHGENVLLRRRPPNGLLGGMTELPGTAWRDTPWTVAEALPLAPVAADWLPVGQVRHGFTHFELIIDLLAAHVPCVTGEGFPTFCRRWTRRRCLRSCANASGLPPAGRLDSYQGSARGRVS